MDHPFLAPFQFFFCINLPPLAEGSILHPWTPVIAFIRYFLLKIIIVRPSITYTTNSLTSFLFLCCYYCSYRKHVQHVQSVSQSVLFLHPVIVLLLFSILTAIRQSKPYTVTFYSTVHTGVLQFSLPYPSFCSTLSPYSLAFGKRNG